MSEFWRELRIVIQKQFRIDVENKKESHYAIARDSGLWFTRKIIKETIDGVEIEIEIKVTATPTFL